MNTKTMIAGALAGIVYFLLGFLIYGILLKGMAGMGGTATGVMRADSEMIWWALIIGNLAFGMAFAYILGTWSGVTTFMGGAKAGATVAFIFELGYDLIWYSVSNLMSLQGVCMDVVISTIMSAIAGGVIGWWLGRSA
jgi:hypothetical protein